MADLLLNESEQGALRAVIASEPDFGGDLPGAGVLPYIARLIDSDDVGIALLDGSGFAIGESALPRDQMDEGDPSSGAEPIPVGIQQRHRGTQCDGSTRARGVAVLSLGVRNGPEHVVTLWLVRRARDFSERDRALLGLVAPALERLMRERPISALPPGLTVQERRVLHHVAAGLSNAEIADRLVVATSTVRKHLEHAYRKLGVTNRLAALNAVEQGRSVHPDPVGDRVDRPEGVDARA